jgi:hypothetical protein
VYYSKTLNKAERIHCFTQQELLAIMRTLESANGQSKIAQIIFSDQSE